MGRERIRKVALVTIWILAVAAAVIFRHVARLTTNLKLSVWLSDGRTAIYFITYIVWGILLRRHVVVRSVKRWLSAIVFLMLFWMIVRTVKFRLPNTSVWGRYLWYSYYLPMIFIPLFCLYTSLHIRKSEDYRLPLWSVFAAGISTALFVLVMTNDVHQAVFSFGEETFWSDDQYHYSWGYYIVMIWVAVCMCMTLLFMMRGAKVPHSKKKKLLPFVPIILIGIYAISYIAKIQALRLIAGDMTSVICQLVMISITCCMWSGLIPVNTGYEQFFNGSTLNAQIRRNDASILASSHNSSLLSEQMVRQAMQTGCCTEKNVRVKAGAIKGGFVVWQEDISLLNTLLESLQKSEKELEVSNALLKAENEIEEKQAKIAAQTQLYDRIEADMKKTIQQIASELSEKKENTAREQLFKISVIGTYMKRRCNLLFLGQKNDQILLDELLYCIRESVDNMKWAGIDGDVFCTKEGKVPFLSVLQMYDCFEQIIELFLKAMETIFVRISTDNGNLTLRMMIAQRLEKKNGQPVMIEQVQKVFDENTRYKVIMEEDEWIIHVEKSVSKSQSSDKGRW